DTVAHVEVWRSLFAGVGQAVRIGTAPGRVFADAVGAGSPEYCYWVRAVGTNNRPGPWNASAGTPAQTAASAAYLREQLAGQLTASELHQDLQTRIDHIDAPGGLLDTTAAPADADQQLTDRLGQAEQTIGEAEQALTERIDQAVQGLQREVHNALALAGQVEAEFGSYRDAISHTDPDSGEIRLYAVDALAESFGGRLSEVEIEL